MSPRTSSRPVADTGLRAAPRLPRRLRTAVAFLVLPGLVLIGSCLALGALTASDATASKAVTGVTFLGLGVISVVVTAGKRRKSPER